MRTLRELVEECKNYDGLHAAIKERSDEFAPFGITTYKNEVNCETGGILLYLLSLLAEAGDTEMHYGYNDPEQGETGEDSGKYYLFAD